MSEFKLTFLKGKKEFHTLVSLSDILISFYKF